MMLDIEKVLAISEMTYRKLKEPAFMLLFVIAGLIGYVVSGMGDFSFNSDSSLLGGIIVSGHGSVPLGGFVIIFFLTLLIAVFVGATDIPRDIDSRMIMLILAKPVRRSEYLLGKYIGTVCLCIVFFLVSATVATVSHIIQTGEIFNFSTLLHQVFLILAFFPFTAITVAVSTCFSDVSAMIVTVVYIVFSVMMSMLIELIEILPQGMHFVSVFYVLYYFFPNFLYYLNSFNNFGLVSLSLFIYTVSVSVIFLLIAAARLKNRDMI